MNKADQNENQIPSQQKCHDTSVDDLIAYADSELSRDRMEAVSSHLEHCQACRNTVKQLTTSLEIVRVHWKENRDGATLRNPVLHQPTVTHRHNTTAWLSRSFGSTTVLLASLLFIAGLGWAYVLQNNTNVKPDQALVIAKNRGTQPETTIDTESVARSLAAVIRQEQNDARLQETIQLMSSIESLSAITTESKQFLDNRKREKMP